MIPLDFAPHTNIIQSIIDEKYPLRVLLAEVIDNALDKRATRISLTVDGENFVVEDNGSGVASMVSLLQWGNHHKDDPSHETMGRFGIGLKHAAIWIGEQMAVLSRYQHQLYSLQVDWQQIRDSGIWRGEMHEPETSPGPSFTMLSFGPVRPGRIKRFALDKIANALAYEYTPALAKGIDISIQGTPLEAVGLPELESAITLDECLNGRHFRLTAGLKPHGNNDPTRYCYDVAYMNRIIVQHDSYGLGEYSGRQFYGYLELLDDGNERWTLSTHKGHFEPCDELYDYLLPFIEPLLEAAEQMGDEIRLDGVRDEVLERMSRIRPIREKRKRGDTHGTKEPKKTGKKREKAEKVNPEEPGSVTRRLQGILDLRFDCHDPEKVGDVQQTKTHTIVSLNPDFALVKTREPNAIVAIVLALLAAHVVKNPDLKNRFGIDRSIFPQILTEGFYNDFIAFYSDLLQRAELTEQQSAAAD